MQHGVWYGNNFYLLKIKLMSCCCGWMQTGKVSQRRYWANLPVLQSYFGPWCWMLYFFFQNARKFLSSWEKHNRCNYHVQYESGSQNILRLLIRCLLILQYLQKTFYQTKNRLAKTIFYVCFRSRGMKNIL